MKLYYVDSKDQKRFIADTATVEEAYIAMANDMRNKFIYLGGNGSFSIKPNVKTSRIKYTLSNDSLQQKKETIWTNYLLDDLK